MELPILYTPKQAASVLGISRSTVYNLLKGGQLGSVHIGRSRRIAQAHMTRYIEELMDAA
jgi:excisionase family DNA binding protein